jgi:DMSO/TMAO reductase YedYZ molybdopterin-dependent catalytic subunit
MHLNMRNRSLSTNGAARVDKPRIVRVGLVLLLLVLGVAGIAAPAPSRAALQATPTASTGAGDAVEITGLVSNPGTLTVADLQMLPSETIQHVQETRQGQVEHTFTGVRLYDVLDLIGLVAGHDERNPLLHRYLVITAKDGHQVVISGGELDPDFGDSPMMLAWEEDGQPLTGDRGPVRLVVPGDERGARQTDGVVRIEIFGIDAPLS